MGWRYIAQRLTGDGLGEFLDWELPLYDVALTDVLSGPIRLKGNIQHSLARLKASDNRPLFDEWGTAIWAEADGEIRGGGILVNSGFAGPKWELDCAGFTYYPKDMPWMGEEYHGIQVDPLDVVRRIWDHVQSFPAGNLGMRVASTTSPIRIGTELELVEFQTGLGENVQFEAGPVKLAPWLTDDLAGKIDQLAKETPFSYHERHVWEGEQIAHHLDLGYPRIGRRRDDLRFVLGENIRTVPDVERDGENFANEILCLGAGEGRAQKRGHVANPDGRLRRVGRIADKSLRSVAQANAAARRELAYRQNLLHVSQIVVMDHPHARVGSWQVGDEIPLQAETDWEDVDLWVRVLSSTINPAQGDAAVLTVARADSVA